MFLKNFYKKTLKMFLHLTQTTRSFDLWFTTAAKNCEDSNSNSASWIRFNGVERMTSSSAVMG